MDKNPNGRFFEVLLAEAARHTNLHKDLRPDRNRLTRRVSQHFVYAYIIRSQRAIVEFEIDGRDWAWNKTAFDALHIRRDAIQADFGHPLKWLRQDRKRVSRVCFDIHGMGIKSEDSWPQLHAMMIDAMVRMERATRPRLESLATVDPATALPIPEEINEPQLYPEGAIRKIWVNAYERNSAARTACLDAHGIACTVCGFEFERAYGEIGREFIHVHHLRPLSEVPPDYEVDPVKDLRPVCPNCHAMLHRRSPPMSIEELQECLRRSERG